MEYRPHAYQEYAQQFVMEHLACALFLEMGMGKGVIVLTCIDQLVFEQKEIRKVLIIAPLRVAKETWPGEAEKWDHLQRLKLSVVVGSEKARQKALAQEAHIYVINRENVEWLVEHYTWDFDMVVIDELSSFKSSTTKRFKALRKVRRQTKRIVGLTGTPAPNSLMQLWSQIYLLDGGKRLGRYLSHYQKAYFVPDKRSRQRIFSYKPRPGGKEQIYAQIENICVSLKACDHLQMPERIDNIVKVNLTKKEMQSYKRLEREALLNLDQGKINAPHAGVLAGKLLQMANGAVYDDQGNVQMIHDQKLEALEELIEAANGKPVLIFYQYKHDRTRIAERFQVCELKDSEAIRKWNRGEIPIAIAHPASSGHGLNLQAGGSTMIWFGLTWNLELYQQANARLYRQGQAETVIIHHLLTAGTIDEQVMMLLAQKESNQEHLLAAIKYLA